MRSSLRILVADGKAEARQALQEELARLGHQVTQVGTGRQMIDLCLALGADLRPHLLVTDIHLPDTDGLEAAAEVNRHEPIPLVRDS